MILTLVIVAGALGLVLWTIPMRNELKELREKVLGPDISAIAMGSMLFNQEFSWLLSQFRDGLFDVAEKNLLHDPVRQRTDRRSGGRHHVQNPFR